MNVGLIARNDNRGLGTMTEAFYRHMRPAKTLVVELDAAMRRGFAPYRDRYPHDATFISWGGGELDETTVRGWLEGLDVVYSAETFYDPRIIGWCEDARVATVLHVMPEFYRADLPAPTAMWVPTSWRLHHMPATVRVVPVPTEPRAHAMRDSAHPIRVVHVAGHRAAGDRNGTSIVLRALRMLQQSMEVTLFCQDQRMPTARGIPSKVRVTRRLGGVADRWSQYENADLLVLPRRYGGLCLPVLEAAASGVGLVLTDTPPNDEWPADLLFATAGGSVTTAAGEIPFANADPRLLARRLDQLAASPATVDELRARARAWATENSWDRLVPTYEAALDDVVAR